MSDVTQTLERLGIGTPPADRPLGRRHRPAPAQSGAREDDARIDADPWPDPVDEAAYHGLAGEIVREIEPHSEADPVAILSQVLVAFGNVIGNGPHFTVEADTHHANLCQVLVGATAKGRKGTAWGQASRPFRTVVRHE